MSNTTPTNGGKHGQSEMRKPESPTPPVRRTSTGEKRKLDGPEVFNQDGPPPHKTRPDNVHGLFRLTSFVADRKGEREEMQDAHLQLDNYSKMLEGLHPSM